MNINFDYPSFQDQTQSPVFNPTFGDARLHQMSGTPLRNHSNFLDSSGQAVNLTDKQQSNFQASPTKKHFDTAYHDVLVRMSTEKHENDQQALISRLLMSPQAEGELAKHHLFTKKSQESSSSRLMRHAAEIKAKHAKLAEDLVQKELSECRFTPQILVSAENESHRTLPQFLASQNSFLENKQAKIETLKTKIAASDAKDNVSKPKLCPESLEMVKKKPNNNAPVYERLYALNKKVKSLDDNNRSLDNPPHDNFFTADKEKTPAENVTFTPKINEKTAKILKNVLREGKPEDRLYHDHFSREKKIEQKRKENESKTLGNSPKESKNSKNVSQKLIAEAFIKEFGQVSGPFVINGREAKFDYLEMCEIMKNLGFFTNTEQLGGVLFERERTLLFELWYTLKGEELNGVSSRNLLLFCLGVLGLSYRLSKDPQKDGFSAKALPKDENRPNFDQEKSGVKVSKSLRAELLASERQEIKEASENDPVLSRSLTLGTMVQNSKEFYEQWAKLKQGRIYGKLDLEGNLELQRKDIKEIHKRFELFCRNRLHNEVLKKTPQMEKPTFEPAILANSKQMAVSYRGKITEKTQDFLKNQALEGKIPETGEFTHAELLILSREAQKYEKSKKTENDLIENMKECTFHPKILFQDQSQDKTDRNIGLFNLSKLKVKAKERSSQEVEYEKNCQECTFHPDLKKPEKESPSNRHIYAKNIDKFIARMRSSQKEREYINSWKNTEVRAFPGKRKPEELVQESLFGKDFEEKLSIFRESSIKEPESPGLIEPDPGFNDSNEKVPLLFVDVNIGPNRTERIIVNEGDSSEDLAQKFATEFHLDDNMRKKLKELLDSQIAGLLHRIDEEMPSVNSEDSYKR